MGREREVDTMRRVNAAKLLARLEAFEHRTHGLSVRSISGPLKRLPEDYWGERHTVIKPLPDCPTGERVEFEERPGPGPDLPIDPNYWRTIYVTYIEPYPSGNWWSPYEIATGVNKQ
jgi:hypothetical protein